MTSQRGVISILTLLLLIISAALGSPGRFPLIGESEITPQFLYDLILGVVAPLALLAGTLYSLFQAITARVRLAAYKPSAQAINPNDLIALTRIPEVYYAAIGAVVFIVQVFTKVILFDEATQSLIADAIMAVIMMLIRSYGDRPPGAAAPELILAESAPYELRYDGPPISGHDVEDLRRRYETGYPAKTPGKPGPGG